jgi:hypothetical protein
VSGGWFLPVSFAAVLAFNELKSFDDFANDGYPAMRTDQPALLTKSALSHEVHRIALNNRFPIQAICPIEQNFVLL